MPHVTHHALPADLRSDLEHAGYFPDLVADVLDVAIAGEPVVSHLVHAETTFDADAVRRHITTLVPPNPQRVLVIKYMAWNQSRSEVEERWKMVPAVG